MSDFQITKDKDNGGNPKEKIESLSIKGNKIPRPE